MELTDGVHRVLEPLVAVSHRVVRGLEDREVPARLRAVRAKSARRLPPPLAKALLASLDELAWLREKVLEQGDELDRLGMLYLERPEGWEQAIFDAVDAERTKGVEARLAAVIRERDLAREAVGVIKRKLKARERRISELESRLRTEKESRNEAIRAAEARVEGRLGQVLDSLREELRSSVERTGELDRLQRRTRWLLATRERPAVEEDRPSGGGGPWSGDPLQRARLLDEVAIAASSTAPARDGTPTKATGARFTLPPGLRPDSPEAIEAVLAHPDSLLIALDGYNVAAEAGLSLERTRLAREYVKDLAVRLDGRSGGRHVVLCVFDGVGEPQRKGNVVFVPFADDELRRLAEEHRDMVVVSNDREVIEDTSGVGATALWTTALVRWAGDG